MNSGNTIYDISVTLGEESIDYPGDTPYSRKSLSTIEKGGVCNLSGLELSTHAGTHLDTPAHFIKTGKTIDQYRVDDFILPALVLDLQNHDSVAAEDLQQLDLAVGTALLFKTDNSKSGRNRNGFFSEDYVFISEGAARICVEKKVSLVGLDYISIDRFTDQSFRAHTSLLSAGILVLEGIDLGKVPAGQYLLCCLPLKIKGAEASPVRAILVTA